MPRKKVVSSSTKPAAVRYAGLGMKRARFLADLLRQLGHDCEAFMQYGDPTVGVDRLKKISGIQSSGTWMHNVTFTDDGQLRNFAGGQRGNPWRGGPEHNAVELAASYVP